ncbi:MAG: hypothetical protein GC188_04885 [Alphaproteobacteria bacterium]|nr:hypothetical protein [Alphaproteobacteria bacterium]
MINAGHNSVRHSLFLIVLISVLSLVSGTAPAQSAGNCVNLASRQQLDFWVGSWNIYSEAGAFLGRQDVTEWETGCLIEAVWTSASGETSQSMNLYDPGLSAWRQIHISPNELADLRGGLSNGMMRLSGNLFEPETQTFSQRRWSVSANGDGSLQQVFEHRGSDTDAWVVERTLTARPAATDPDSPVVPTVSAYQPGQPGCWGLAERNDFSFAAGDWNIGAAHNRLALLQSGCLLRERWQASGNDTGVSYNFYDPFTDQWRQVWISPFIFIDMTGGRASPNGPMSLSGTIWYHNGNVAPFRASWTPQSATSMVQFMEQQNGSVWTTWFNATYVRSSATAQADVTISGLGSGQVSSNPAGLSCSGGPSGCSANFRLDAPVSTSGQPAAGSSFTGWSDGPCFGQSGDCSWNIGRNIELTARFTLNTVPDGRIVAAVLPGARSTYVGGNDVTVFASVISRASTPAQSCTIAAPDNAPASLRYRRVDSSNTAIGPPNPVFDLEASGSASFVLAISPTATTPAEGNVFAPVVSCENALLDAVPGVNTFSLSIDTVPVPDILSISATPSADGVIRIANSGGINFMTAAAVNIGAGDGSAGAEEATITVTADDGGANLPLTLQVCETGPQGGCLAPRSGQVTTVFASDAKFFAVFARAQAGSAINFNPGGARVFLRFRDANGVVRSVTSAAVTAPE